MHLDVLPKPRALTRGAFDSDEVMDVCYGIMGCDTGLAQRLFQHSLECGWWAYGTRIFPGEWHQPTGW